MNQGSGQVVVEKCAYKENRPEYIENIFRGLIPSIYMVLND